MCNTLSGLIVEAIHKAKDQVTKSCHQQKQMLQNGLGDGAGAQMRLFSHRTRRYLFLPLQAQRSELELRARAPGTQQRGVLRVW